MQVTPFRPGDVMPNGGIFPFAPGSFEPVMPPSGQGIAPFAPGSFEPVMPGGVPRMTDVPVGGPLSAADRQRLYGGTTGVLSAQARRRAAEAGPAEQSDWSAIIEALGNLGGGGGYTPVSVRRDLFQLSQTPEEQALLDRELSDIEARRAAGTQALGASWSQLSQANAAAAEKARQQVVQYGDTAAAAWMDAANRARQLASERAQAAGAVAGRQSINVSPTGGAADFIAFMESQAPAAQQFAQRTQETLASDLDWLASTAGAQGTAYQGELQRQANVLAFERAREHNRAVQERMAAERMALANMEFQAATTNAQLAQAAAQRSGASANQIYQAQRLALINDPEGGPAAAAILASLLNIPADAAQQLARSAAGGTLPAIIAAELE